MILTAGCAKYRYNKLPLGDIEGVPRVLDAGQCNDSYSLVRIALALKDAFKVDSINDLPIVFNIAWYEQKHRRGKSIPQSASLTAPFTQGSR